MDFFQVKERFVRGNIEIYPDFQVNNGTDLMIRGKSFYAVWDESKGIWSQNEYDAFRFIDEELYAYGKKMHPESQNLSYKTMRSFETNSSTKFKAFLSTCPDNYHTLNENILFANNPIKKKDYASKRLKYILENGSCNAYDELISTLYSPEERKKLEWSIGAIITGASKTIQKFIVLYGEPGSGKSTFLNIVQMLFDGYYSTFDAKSLVGNANAFATEVFRDNSLIAIQHDGDLSKIEDNTKINSIISHEDMIINEKFKTSYTSRLNCFLYMGTNQPVRITNSKSGIIRRLIDVRPTGARVPPEKYNQLMKQIEFELGAIAYKCKKLFNKLGEHYYNSYRPQEMIMQTNVFYNFVDENYFVFKESDGITLDQAYRMYKQFCEESECKFTTPKHIFREELKDYFYDYFAIKNHKGADKRHLYMNFKEDRMLTGNALKQNKFPPENFEELKLNLFSKKSKLDTEFGDSLAQYANIAGTPKIKWSQVQTKLNELDTSQMHYVIFDKNHIVLDFDLKDENGKKSAELNLKAAALYPITYAEYSKSGEGVHLHYIYDGDITKLAKEISEGIEIKTFIGNASLRRKLSYCNEESINKIAIGSLPLKEERSEISMVRSEQIMSERGLRKMIERNLNKEFHSGTKPSCDFINKILNDAYNSGMKYDVKDLRNKVLQFAMKSSNQAEYCLNLVNQMKFESEVVNESIDVGNDEDIVFFDCEVFPNLFVVVYKKRGKDKDPVIMINPSPEDMDVLFSFKLVGFNCRKYDNHILYARSLGYDNEKLYNLSQKIIVSKDKGGMFGDAYNISYTDIYDFSNTKQGLKKWEIELGLKHQECPYRWDEPVSEEFWQEVADYCCNDVISTEVVFEHLNADWTARKILAKISNGSVNDTTNTLATRFIFGNEKHPQLVYTDLTKTFPGYELRMEEGKDGNKHLVNFYRDTDVGFGGYVFANHGVYYNVALLDVASMHPTSLILLNYFGDYTPKFAEILSARLCIKHGRYDDARNLMGGALRPFLDDESQSDALAYALKIVVNSQYGLTSSKFESLPQFDKRNVNNIVALRGALFMRTLQDEITNRGFEVVHIKTDSIKIADASQEIIDFCMEFAKSYGYTFEHEATYEKMCLITDADYIAKYAWAAKAKNIGKWTATGAQFAHPYVFKTLFSREDIMFEDLCETKSVKTSLHLDMNEDLLEREHDYRFIGRVGQFCPITEGRGGGVLLAQRGEKYAAVTGTKGYRWLESEVIRTQNKQDDIYMPYFTQMADEMFNRIGEYTDPEIFCSNNIVRVGDENYDIDKDSPPIMECGAMSCELCPNLTNDRYHVDCKEEFDNTDYILSQGEYAGV